MHGSTSTACTREKKMLVASPPEIGSTKMMKCTSTTVCTKKYFSSDNHVVISIQ